MILVFKCSGAHTSPFLRRDKIIVIFSWYHSCVCDCVVFVNLQVSLFFGVMLCLFFKQVFKLCRRNFSYLVCLIVHFYAPPQKVAGYYVIPSEILSVCPSVCSSVRPSAVDHSCPLHNFDTVQDNFTKLATNIKHDQTTCRN